MSSSYVEGEDFTDPVDGEHVKVFLHLKPQGPPSAMPGSSSKGGSPSWNAPVDVIEQRTEQAVIIRSGNNDVHSTHFFDQVLSQPRMTPAERCALLKPYARGVVSGTSTSLVYYESSCSNALVETRPGFFDKSTSQCVAMLLIEQVVLECKQKMCNAYLSFGVYNDRERHVVDILASTGSGLLGATPLEPKCGDGTLFPKMHEINVTLSQKPSEVLRMALTETRRLEDRALLPSNTSMFACLSVTIPVKLGVGQGVHMHTARLYLLDVVRWSHMRLLARVGSEPVLTPWLQRPHDVDCPPEPLPLVAFGVGMEHRCVVLACIPAERYTTSEPHDAASGHRPKTLLDVLQRLRLVVTASCPFAARISLPPVSTEEVAAWRSVSESMRLRRLANRLGRSDSSTTQMEIKNQPDVLLEEQRRLSNALAAQLWHRVLDPDSLAFSCGATTWRLFKDRVALIRQVQLELMEEHETLETRRKWLLSLPVTGTGMNSSISDVSRWTLLEKSVRLLEEENERQRALFARDISLLELEMSAAQGIGRRDEPVEPRDSSSEGYIASSLSTLWRRLCEEMEDLSFQLSRTRRTDDVSSVDTRAALTARADGAIADFVDSLKHDIRVLLDLQNGQANGGEEGTLTARHSSREFIQSLMDASLHSVMASVSPSASADAADFRVYSVGVNVESNHLLHEQWEQMILERATARAELCRVRHAAESLALLCRRSIAQLDDLAATIRKQAEEGANRNHKSDGHVPLVSVVGSARSRSRSTLASRVTDMLAEEEAKMRQETVPPEVRDVYEPPLLLAVERYRAAEAALLEIALGYAEPALPAPTVDELGASLHGLISSRLLRRGQQEERTQGNHELVATSFRELTKGEVPTSEETLDRVPTLAVSLDAILRGKRLVEQGAVSSSGVARLRSPLKRLGGFTQGHFSSQLLNRKSHGDPAATSLRTPTKGQRTPR